MSRVIYKVTWRLSKRERCHACVLKANGEARYFLNSLGFPMSFTFCNQTPSEYQLKLIFSSCFVSIVAPDVISQTSGVREMAVSVVRSLVIVLVFCQQYRKYERASIYSLSSQKFLHYKNSLHCIFLKFLNMIRLISQLCIISEAIKNKLNWKKSNWSRSINFYLSTMNKYIWLAVIFYLINLEIYQVYWHWMN